VKGWREGSFLAPDSVGHAFFIDTRGSVSVISRSERLLPVAFHLAAKRAAERSDLAGRIGRTEPAPDDDA
jgi:hypothetical protein